MKQIGFSIKSHKEKVTQLLLVFSGNGDILKETVDLGRWY